MRQVIEAIDGPIYLNLCLISGASCDRKGFCPAHPIWGEAQEAMLSVLDKSIVGELAVQASARSSRDNETILHSPELGVGGKAVSHSQRPARREEKHSHH
jgi:DNA-binding IscR family transcriptional regulator